VLARFLGGAADVSLRRPIPLDTPLDVVAEGAGSVQMLESERVVAEARSSAEIDVDLPAPPVAIHEARAATARYRGATHGVFSRCFVCGRAREDAFGVFPGAVAGRRLVASPWTPPASTADDAGHVLPEFVWAVLDCPTYFALHMERELSMSVLARFAARVDAPVVVGVEHVVIAWPIEIAGRKQFAGAALLASDGEPLAVARALLIEPRTR
jgi:hypothetical protein